MSQAPDSVKLSRADFEAMQKSMADLKAGYATLYEAADKGRLAMIEGRSQVGVTPVVKLSRLEHNGQLKVVVAWRMVKDEVFKAANGAWVENQVVEVIFEDDSKYELSLVDFARKTQQKMSAKVLSREPDGRGGETMKVEGEDGKVRVIAARFVN